MKLSPIPSRPLDHSDRRIFVWKVFKKNVQITRKKSLCFLLPLRPQGICLFGLFLKNRRVLIFLIFPPTTMKLPDFLPQRQLNKHASRLLIYPFPSLSLIGAIRSINVIRVKNFPQPSISTLPIPRGASPRSALSRANGCKEKFGIIVPNIFLKSRRITLGMCAERVPRLSLLPSLLSPLCPLVSFVLKMNFSRTIPLLADYLNRGSIQLLHPPSPFLVPVQTPGFLPEIPCFTFTKNCLNIIEPRFEPQTARGRKAHLHPSAKAASRESSFFHLSSFFFHPLRVYPRFPRPIHYSLFTIHY
jgi:hypothetical protein